MSVDSVDGRRAFGPLEEVSAAGGREQKERVGDIARNSISKIFCCNINTVVTAAWEVARNAF